MATNGKPADQIRATAYLEAAISAVEKREKRAKKMEFKKRKTRTSSRKRHRHSFIWELKPNLYQQNLLPSYMLQNHHASLNQFLNRNLPLLPQVQVLVI